MYLPYFSQLLLVTNKYPRFKKNYTVGSLYGRYFKY